MCRAADRPEWVSRERQPGDRRGLDHHVARYWIAALPHGSVAVLVVVEGREQLVSRGDATSLPAAAGRVNATMPSLVSLSSLGRHASLNTFSMTLGNGWARSTSCPGSASLSGSVKELTWS